MIKLPQENCSGCHACSQVCPQQCITMTPDSEGFLYPIVDTDKCVNCKLCEKNCPVLLPLAKREQEPQTYAAYSKDTQIRLQSSSGGVFSLVAGWIIEKGGVVFGAAFTENFTVSHIFIETKSDLAKLRGSKYVQSEIGASYKRAKDFLNSGRLVLFTGTPCQIAGLKVYLKREYDNLICQDIICHGVPSPMIWQKYIQFRESKAVSKTRRTFFRDKRFGWKTFSVSFEFSNNTEYVKILSEDFYMKAFLRNLSLRPSCYNCSFKTINRQSDITLADFWGIQNILPQLDDDKGTSLIFLHTDKGKTIFEDLKSDIVYQEVNALDAVKFNSAMIKSVDRPKQRDVFFNSVQKYNFDKAVKKCCKNSILNRIFKKIKSIL